MQPRWVEIQGNRNMFRLIEVHTTAVFRKRRYKQKVIPKVLYFYSFIDAVPVRCRPRLFLQVGNFRTDLKCIRACLIHTTTWICTAYRTGFIPSAWLYYVLCRRLSSRIFIHFDDVFRVFHLCRSKNPWGSPSVRNWFSVLHAYYHVLWPSDGYITCVCNARTNGLRR